MVKSRPMHLGSWWRGGEVCLFFLLLFVMFFFFRGLEVVLNGFLWLNHFFSEGDLLVIDFL